MPLDAHDISDIETARVWAVEHDANIKAWWSEQHKWNARYEALGRGVDTRLHKLERRMIWLAGFGSAVLMLAGVVATVLGFRTIGP